MASCRIIPCRYTQHSIRMMLPIAAALVLTLLLDQLLGAGRSRSGLTDPVMSTKFTDTEALAGVMGGEETEVDSSTTNLLTSPLPDGAHLYIYAPNREFWIIGPDAPSGKRTD